MRKGGSFSKEKKRTCYNCDESGHFSNMCPYEKRLDKPKYDKGARPKLKPNPLNDKNRHKNKREGKAFLGTEYSSDEESDEEETEGGVAGLALAKPGSLFKYDYTKDYAPNSNKVSHKSFMAKGPKVISPPSLTSILDDEKSENDNDDVDEHVLLAKLYKTMISLRGKARKQFEYLMDTVASRNESIDELTSQVEDGRRRYFLLKDELTEERDHSATLAKQIESCELDRIKNMDILDRSLLMSQELDASKKELEVAHASLTKDCEQLDNANKLIKGELSSLREKYDQLRATNEKSLGSSNVPICVENIACASNSTIDQALLVEENKKLKEQLEKERLSSKKGKGLDEILSQQRGGSFKQGLGFDPKKNKKVVNPPKKIVFVKQGQKEVDNVKKKVVNGGATRGNPKHMNAGDNNPSYVLCKGTEGNVYAKYVGPLDDYTYIWYSIWVPKTLVANAKGPITQWVPKLKS